MRRFQVVVLIAGVLILAGSALALFAFAEARADPIVRQLTVPVRGWPANAPPMRVALLSDVHIGSAAMDATRLARIVDQVNAARPDLVLIAGDMVFGHDPAAGARYAAALTAPLSGLRARYGVVAVPGNHDHWTALAAIRRALERAGVTVLANRSARRGPLLILGIDDAFSGHADVKRTFAGAGGGVPVVLSHAPDVIASLPAGRAPLVLTGHTHCGQVRLPGIDPARQPLSGNYLYDPHYRCGVVRDPARTVVVTAGLGTSGVPLRLRAPPDWWMIRFAAAPR